MSLELFKNLRRRFNRFVYRSYEITGNVDAVDCRFSYILIGENTDILFEHKVSFVSQDSLRALESCPLFKRAAFLLGLVEAVSYWKTACPVVFEVKAGHLYPEELVFWQKIFTRGLGELWWLNGIHGHINEDEYIKIIPSSNSCPLPVGACESSGWLIPVGGGKDSVVTMELLKGLEEKAASSDCFMLSARKASYETAEIAGFGKSRTIEAFRTLDPKVIAMNKEGYLNGHVPYSAILGFASVAAALLHRRRFVILSNEGSANEPTVPGTWVNHQYSKSLEFELDFSSYINEFLTPSVTYFSLLRPWSEARIAIEFAKHPKYHRAFKSCNRGSAAGIWCCECPKCLFVFILLAAHLGVKGTEEIFGENLLLSDKLVPEFDALMGRTAVKPFECVGTIEETVWSMSRICERSDLSSDAGAWPVIKRFYEHHIKADNTSLKLVDAESGEGIPFLFRGLVLDKEQQENITAELIKKLEHKKLGILGYGMEGKSTLKLLKELLPEADITIADEAETAAAEYYSSGKPELQVTGSVDIAKDSADFAGIANIGAIVPAKNIKFFSGPDYLNGLMCCDLIFKAPGIALKKIDASLSLETISSQADIFLSVLGHRTIGVTGTKGKSTTCALIHAALLACGIDAMMVGNMGLPPLDAIKNDVPSRIYVFELSSHMLETVKHSPRGAVYLNLYEEHLDHYRSFFHYAEAKGNIIAHQGAGSFALLGDESLSSYLPTSPDSYYSLTYGENGTLFLPTEAASSSSAIPVSCFAERLLPGEHNLRNIQLSILAVHLWLTKCSLPEGNCKNNRGLLSPAMLSAAVAAVNSFSGLPHRMQKVATVSGITFWDDSISTIPEACIHAVNAIRNVETLIFGGMDRGIAYAVLDDFLRLGKVLNLIGLPDTGHAAIARLNESPGSLANIRTYCASGMAEAVDLAFRVTGAGKSCLLSPAAASYGWYRNFEDRGDHYCRLVLKKKAESLV